MLMPLGGAPGPSTRYGPQGSCRNERSGLVRVVGGFSGRDPQWLLDFTPMRRLTGIWRGLDHEKRLWPLRVAIPAALIASLGAMLPADALGTTPGNDNFASRQVVSGALPVEVTGSNVEATKEAGEFLPGGPAPAGHSVWYEWEAMSTGWVTIGACDDDFRTIVAIFSGTEVDHLTAVAGGNADEGPGCLGQNQLTFKAISGNKYEIAVDGNIFHLPEEPVPVTEGAIMLRIEATPPPPNDDFADAIALQAPIGEEPGGDRFYYAGAQGYNWTATTEFGEPGEGSSSGASVWYSWTAPESGEYTFGALCCGTGLHWSLYLGNSLVSLKPFLIGAETAKVFTSAGATYWIQVFGDIDPETEEPTMASFNFHISASLPPLPRQPPSSGGASQAVRDSTPPETSISKRVMRSKPGAVRLTFHSSEPGSSFRCSIDGKAFGKCGSSLTFRRPSPRRRAIRVYAVDPAGNPDPTPAVAHFKIVQRSGR
jgi:hypothetical protein